MVELREIYVEDFEEFIEENGTEAQSEYFDSNIHGLAEAMYVMRNGNNLSKTYSIFYNDEEIGYILVVYQPKDMDNPEDYNNAYYMSRIIIEKRYRSWGIREKAETILTDLFKEELEKAIVTL